MLGRAGLDHAQGVSAQAVVEAAGDRAFCANGLRRRHGPARPFDRDDAAAGESTWKQAVPPAVFDPVNECSLKPMFRCQPITQIILLAKVINTHAY